jgi:hypothetical protein
LEIHECSDLRKHWNDTTRRKIEDFVEEFFIAPLNAAVFLRSRREDRRLVEIMRQRREGEIAALREQIKFERRRLDDLLKRIEDWRRVQSLREFLSACRAKHDRGGLIEANSELEAWLKWADQQADRLDPLTESPSSVLDREQELPRW